MFSGSLCRTASVGRYQKNDHSLPIFVGMISISLVNFLHLVQSIAVSLFSSWIQVPTVFLQLHSGFCLIHLSVLHPSLCNPCMFCTVIPVLSWNMPTPSQAISLHCRNYVICSLCLSSLWMAALRSRCGH